VSQEFEQAIDGVDSGRRAFLKKMAVTTAFAAPVVSSFTMTGIKAVYAQTPRVSGQVSGGTANQSTSTTSGSSPTTTTGRSPTTTTSSTSTSTTSSTTTSTTTTTQANSTFPG
jgi:hypothetical protein